MLKRIAVLALLCVSLAVAKTYTFTITAPTYVGDAQLGPGEYRLKLDGSQIVLIEPNGNRIEVVATLQEGNRKFDQTMLLTSAADGTNRIVAVELAGSKTSVVFQ